MIHSFGTINVVEIFKSEPRWRTDLPTDRLLLAWLIDGAKTSEAERILWSTPVSGGFCKQVYYKVMLQ